MFLTKEELQELTHAVQRAPMIQWLKAEGFQFRVAIDGYPVVLREHVRAVMGGLVETQQKKFDIDLTWMKERREARAKELKEMKEKRAKREAEALAKKASKLPHDP